MSFRQAVARYSIATLISTVTLGASLGLADVAQPVVTNAVSSTSSNEAASSSSAQKDRGLEILVGLSGEAIRDEYVQGTDGGASVLVSGFQQFTQELRAQLGLSFSAFTGSASGLFSDEAKPFSGLTIREGWLGYKPFKPFEVQLGVIRTHFASESLMVPRGFPGASERLAFGDPNYLQVSFLAQQVMPYQFTLSSEYSSYNSMPTLLMNSLSLEGKPAKPLKLSTTLTYYSFNSMTEGSAQDSRYLGNTVDGLGSSAASYAYGFEGLEAAAGADLDVSKSFSLGLSGSTIYNVQAPTDHNRGMMATVVGKYKIKNTTIGLDTTYFYDESDTLPALYTGWDSGNNNRKGFAYGGRIDVALKNPQELSFFARWIPSKVIQSTPYQADRNYFTIGTETTYVLF